MPGGDPSAETVRRTRGQSAGLDRALIVEAARSIPIKDLTVQAVANKLGVHRKAIHHYVSDRPTLLELVAEDLYASHLSPEGIGADTSWQEACLLLGRATRDSVLATGHFAFFLRLSSPAGDAALGAVDLILGKMRDAGFELVDAVRGIYTLSALAMALAQGQLAAQGGEHPQVPETRRALLAAPGRHPLLQSVFDGGGEVFDDESFDISIRTFIDGLASRVDSSR